MNALLSLEQSVLVEGREWTRERLETQAQKEVNDWGAICPESGLLLKYRKRQRLQVTTCAGVIVLKTTRGFSTALDAGSIPRASAWAQRANGLVRSYNPAWPSTPRRLVPMRKPPPPPRALGHAHQRRHSACGHAVGRAGLRLDFTCATLTTTPSPEFSIVIMMDGWLVRRRGPHWEPVAGKIAERVEWKEVKSAVLPLGTKRQDSLWTWPARAQIRGGFSARKPLLWISGPRCKPRRYDVDWAEPRKFTS
jgi:hypothetical protein